MSIKLTRTILTVANLFFQFKESKENIKSTLNTIKSIKPIKRRRKMVKKNTAFDIAKSYLGDCKEYPGPAENNPDIMEMFATIGHPNVENDETAWCAAKLLSSAMYEKVGIRSTRALNARSYQKWGIEISNKDNGIENAKEGDVVVFWRESPKSWKGHVAFYVRHTKTKVYVLGGNQRNEVSIVSYPRTRILTIRRAGEADADVNMPLSEIQRLLNNLGYHLGKADGLMGPMTRSAILSFKSDNGIELNEIITKEFKVKLEDPTTNTREFFKSRKNGKPKSSRILKNANVSIGLSTIGGLAAIGTQIVDALDNTKAKVEEEVNRVKDQASGLGDKIEEEVDRVKDQVKAVGDKVEEEVNRVKDQVENVTDNIDRYTWVIAANLDNILFGTIVAVSLGVVVCALLSRRARLQDHRNGATLK